MMHTLPKLLLHCCCAPCATSVLERLASDYDITLFFYNPNIEPEDEFNKRASEVVKLLQVTQKEFDGSNHYVAKLAPYKYRHEDFHEVAAHTYGDNLKCRACIELRLIVTAETAGKNNYDFFCTTLTVSPHKDAVYINEIGSMIAKRLEDGKPKYLTSDFKKQDGFKRSVELSKLYGLYRQNYCGCLESKK